MNKADGLWKSWCSGKEVKVYVGFGQIVLGYKGAKRCHSRTAGWAVSLEDTLQGAMDSVVPALTYQRQKLPGKTECWQTVLGARHGGPCELRRIPAHRDPKQLVWKA